MKTRVGIITDGRRTPLYQPGLLEALVSSFERAGAGVSILDLLAESPKVKDFDLFYPLPVVSSGRLLDFLTALVEAPVRMVNPLKVQLTTLDKSRSIERLDEYGVPYPETLRSGSATEVKEFVREHGKAILKANDQVAGLGHAAVEIQGGTLYGWIPNVHRHRQILREGPPPSEAGWRLPLTLVGEDERDAVGPLVTRGSRRTPTVRAPFLVQRLVRSKRGSGGIRDRVMRLYCVGGKPLFGTARVMELGDQPHLSQAIVNYAWGGKYVISRLEDLPPELVSTGCRAAEALEMDAGAIDLIEDEDGRWLVLEGESDNLVYHLCRGYWNAEGFDSVPSFSQAVAEEATHRARRGEIREIDSVSAGARDTLMDSLDGIFLPVTRGR